MSGRQEFFDQVFQVLSSVDDPRGLTFAEIGKRVHRRNFDNVPKWAAIPRSDARFQVDGQRLMLRRRIQDQMRRGQDQPGGEQGQRLESIKAARSFSEYLKSRNVTGGWSVDAVKSSFLRWMLDSGCRSNFNKTIAALKNQKLARIGQNQFIYFSGQERIFNFEAIQRSTCGIVISNVVFARCGFINFDGRRQGRLAIRNEGTLTRSLLRCEFVKNPTIYSIGISTPLTINPGQEVQVLVSCEATDFTIPTDDTLILTFSGSGNDSTTVRQQIYLHGSIQSFEGEEIPYQNEKEMSEYLNSVDSEEDKSVDWIYEPATQLSSSLPLNQALEKARLKRRYVVVNLQNHNSLASHSLNRDVWSDETIKSLLTEGNYQLWQRGHTSLQGMEFMQQQQNNIEESQLPVIMMLHPDTRDMLWLWRGIITPEDLTSRLMEIADVHPLDDAVPSPVVL
eukprot:gene7433-8220_t